MDSKGRRCRISARGPSRMPGDNCLSRMPGANYGNRWSLAIDLWQAPIQTLTGCAPSRSSSLRPDTLNSTLGIPVVVYQTTLSGRHTISWLGAGTGFTVSTMTLAWRAADVRLRHQWGPGVADHIQDAGKFRVNPKFPSWWLWISHDPRCQRHPMMSRHLIDIAILRQSLFIEMGL